MLDCMTVECTNGKFVSLYKTSNRRSTIQWGLLFNLASSFAETKRYTKTSLA